ncbi:MAG: class I SAM-dependent methyltransferase [Actinomycetota bacterium]
MTNGDPTELARTIEAIEGWLHPAEAWELHEAARTTASPPGDTVVVEIGSWKGRSTVALGLGLRAHGGGKLYAVDPLVPSPMDGPGGIEARFQEFLGNLESAGVRDLVEPVREMSHDARPRFDGRRVDVLFIDGDHDYAAVLQDIDDWMPLVPDGAVVALNDPFWPGVTRAIVERATRKGSPLREPRFVVNTIFFRHRPRAPWARSDAAMAARLRLLLRIGGPTMKVLERMGPRTPRRVLGPVVRAVEAALPRLVPNRRP